MAEIENIASLDENKLAQLNLQLEKREKEIKNLEKNIKEK